MIVLQSFTDSINRKYSPSITFMTDFEILTAVKVFFIIFPDLQFFLSGIRQVFRGKSHSFSDRLDMEDSNRWAAPFHKLA